MQLSTKSPERGIRKRRRPAHSCVECRRRKVRCDRANPCSQCVAHNAPSCTFTDSRHATSDHDLPETQVNKQQEHRTPRILDGPLSSNISPPTPAPSGQIHGTLSKTRVFGQGHWISTIPLVSHNLFLFRIVDPLLTADQGLRIVHSRASHGISEYTVSTSDGCKPGTYFAEDGKL